MKVGVLPWFIQTKADGIQALQGQILPFSRPYHEHELGCHDKNLDIF